MNYKPKNSKKAILFMTSNEASSYFQQQEINAQEKRLKNYCRKRGIVVVLSYKDYPFRDDMTYYEMIEDIKSKLFNVDYLLFTSWTIIAPRLNMTTDVMGLLAKHKILPKAIWHL